MSAETAPGNVFELARRPVIRIGSAMVDPATRMVAGPGGETTLEPRVMQVLLLLADARGQVVTRDDFIARCWNGQIVGDDALNRTIGEVRRVARTTAAESFVIETIPKTGYRLIATDPATPAQPAPQVTNRRGVTRRGAIAAAGGAALIAGAGWWLARPARDPRVAELMAQGARALREGVPEDDHQGIGFLRQAVQLAPRDAEAWGLLALAYAVGTEQSAPAQMPAKIAACEAAAARALELQPDQGNAQVARVMLIPFIGSWQLIERQLRHVLAIEPANIAAAGHLGMLMQAVGRVGEAVRFTAQVTTAEPLSPLYQYRFAYQLWSQGKLGQADRVIDNAMTLWPAHSGVRYCRMLIFATTGRGAAAMRLIDSNDGHAFMPPPVAMAWRRTIVAAGSGRAADRADAIATIMAIAAQNSAAAVNAMLGLATLGALDPLFQVCEGYYLRRGPMMGEIRTTGMTPTAEQRWRKTMSLFVPVMAPARADPRFGRLVEEIGMAEYWRQAGVQPDYRRGSA